MSSSVSPAQAGSVVTFADLGLCEPVLKAITKEGYTTPTPIQAQAVPHVIRGRDLLGCAQTGTGKTAAFALPILHHLMQQPAPAKGTRRPIRALVLTPTRELAIQIHESFKTYGQFCSAWYAVIFGGVGQNPQVKMLQNGVDVVIATPGRLLDLMNQGFVDLRHIQHLVLDEADNMLDMGFIHDIRKIIARVPEKRQTLLFSATMPREIRHLAEAILTSPVDVAVTPVATPVEKITQSVQFVEKQQKPAALVEYLNSNAIERAVVFTRTKHGADRVVKTLQRVGVHALAIHGNKSQNNRQRALAAFKSDAPPILVATDIAARGLDIDNVSHVINYEIPNVPETYVHRIGRTARAGNSGVAVSFCDHEEREFLRDIQKLIRRNIPVAATPQNLAIASEHAAEHHPLPERHAQDRTPMRPPVHQNTNRGHRDQQGQRPRPHQPTQSQSHSKPQSQPQGPRHFAQRPHAPRPAFSGPQSARASLASYTDGYHQPSDRQANGVKHPKGARPQHQGGHRQQGRNGQPRQNAAQPSHQQRRPHPHKVGGGVRPQNRSAHPLSRSR